ncbi:MAG: hypothetical protein GXO22_04035 [Aquificae bacterium]|nr:hypothetical protein [Aquificota bacterium]
MADFTKAGSDKGDVEKQLKHLLISANLTYHSYIAVIEDLSKEELEGDLREYVEQYTLEILPMVKKIEAEENDKLIEKANEIKKIYENLIKEIKDKIKETN